MGLGAQQEGLGGPARFRERLKNKAFAVRYHSSSAFLGLIPCKNILVWVKISDYTLFEK